jgi:hypothetical protein
VQAFQHQQQLNILLLLVAVAVVTQPTELVVAVVLVDIAQAHLFL